MTSTVPGRGTGRWYLLKQIRGTDLIKAVHRVTRGESLLDPT